MSDTRLLEIDYTTPPVDGSLVRYNAANSRWEPWSKPTPLYTYQPALQNISSAVIANLLTLNVTLRTGERAFVTGCANYSSDNVADLTVFYLRRGATTLPTGLFQQANDVARADGKYGAVALQILDNPGAGTYTYALSWANNGVNTSYSRAHSLSVIIL